MKTIKERQPGRPRSSWLRDVLKVTHLTAHCWGGLDSGWWSWRVESATVHRRLRVLMIMMMMMILHIAWWRLGLVVNTLNPINEVDRRRTRLVLGWVAAGTGGHEYGRRNEYQRQLGRKQAHRAMH